MILYSKIQVGCQMPQMSLTKILAIVSAIWELPKIRCLFCSLSRALIIRTITQKAPPLINGSSHMLVRLQCRIAELPGRPGCGGRAFAMFQAGTMRSRETFVGGPLSFRGPFVWQICPLNIGVADFNF